MTEALVMSTPTLGGREQDLCMASSGKILNYTEKYCNNETKLCFCRSQLRCDVL